MLGGVHHTHRLGTQEGLQALPSPVLCRVLKGPMECAENTATCSSRSASAWSSTLCGGGNESDAHRYRRCVGGHRQRQGKTLTWTRITDQDEAADLLPGWLGRRLIGLHGRFGLLLATGDVMRITSIGAVHMSSDGLVLLAQSQQLCHQPPLGAELARNCAAASRSAARMAALGDCSE